MNRQRLRVALVALLCVLALGMAAATLDSTRDVGSDGGGIGDSSSTGAGSGERFSLGQSNVSADSGAGSGLPRWVGQLFFALVVLLTVVSAYVAYREYGVRDIVGACLLFVLALVFVWALLGITGRNRTEPRGGSLFSGGMSLPEGGGTAGERASDVVQTVDPPVALLVLLGLTLVVGVAVVLRSSADSASPDPEPDEREEPAQAVEAVGEAAGRAADHIEGDADTSNAVYRAWHDMTDALDVTRPETSTPAEFATAAVDAGMAREDVRELTDLFEAVRYGGQPPSAEREQRAVEALRRIEATYAEDEG